ncbi:MAG TPA: tetratricopeptide repeat protein [Daejeonella sp.]|nr:tetratricopeptide repeat protein [Daejeonella sp.]
MKTTLIILTLLLLPHVLLAQKKESSRTDSLLQALQAARQDTVRVKILNSLASELLKNGKADSAVLISSSSLNLSKKISFPRGEAQAHFGLGQAYASKSMSNDALANYQSAQKLYKQLKRPEEVAETYYSMGMIHQRANYDAAIQFFKNGLETAQQTSNKNLAGKLAYITAVVLIRKSEYNEAATYKDLAIKYYTESANETGLANCYVVSARLNNQKGNVQQSLKDNYSALHLFEKTGNKVGIYNVHTGLGLMYEDQKNWKEALKSYLLAKKAADEQQNKMVLGGAYNNLGNAYRELGQTAEALDAFEQALKLSEITNDIKGIAAAQGNLGTIYSLMGKQTDALKSFDEARKRFEAIGSKESVSISYLESGSVYFDMNKLEESKRSVNQALQLSKQVGYKEIISKSYRLLSRIDSATGNYASALKNYQQFINYRDSIANAESARQLLEQRMQYAFSKKEDSLRLEQALIAEQLDKQTLLSKKQQQDLKLKQAALELTNREKDVQMLTFLKAKAELQLSNEQKEKRLSLAEQERALQKSQLEKQTLISKQKEQALLLKDKELTVQRSQRNIYLIGAIAFLLLSFFILRNNRQKQKANVELQKQKIETEKALQELKNTQTQLIQREKMASLGDLTAGIAHELQNPLNFVNNFAGLNKELVLEMKEELAKGNYAGVTTLAADIENNGEKIVNHGQRAAAIINSMLEHSHGGTGEKQPTDINRLADEYLWLAYHGLQARDKDFKAGIQTHYSNDVGTVNVVPQEMGRVFLNLYNNAFYAVLQKKKKLGNTFEPEVIMNTRKVDGHVEIHVKDNGTGIPQKAVNKIFQPFFTTKPAGEGTGLGLSLSYDIVTKGHGGDIAVDTKEGEYSEFIVQLPVG